MISKNNWNERFCAGALGGAEPLPVVRRALQLLAPGEMIDLACGPGRHSILAARAGWRVTAVDSSPEALRQLAARCPSAALIRADLEQGGLRLGRNRWRLVVQTLYLNRGLFPAIREAVAPGGLYCAAFLSSGRFGIRPEEVLTAFPGWMPEEAALPGPELHCVSSGGGRAAYFQILLRKAE
jgi:SAM-dependent methyltransferase